MIPSNTEGPFVAPKAAVFQSLLVWLRSPWQFLCLTVLNALILGFVGQWQSQWGQFHEMALLSQAWLMLWSLSLGAYLFFLVCLRLEDLYRQRSNSSLWKFSFHQVYPLFLESMRVLARLFVWLLALIVPSFYWYARYQFVPLIVLFDADYEAGRVDALATSRKISSSIHIPLFIFIIFTMALGIGLEVCEAFIPEAWLDQNLNLWIFYSFKAVASTCLSTYSLTVIYLWYRQYGGKA